MSRFVGFLFIVALVAASVSVVAAEPGKAPSVGPVDATKTRYDIQITEADKAKLFVVPVGRTIYLRLPGDKDSGYSWQITKLDKEIVKQVGAARFDAGLNVAGRNTRAGAFIFQFTAQKPGKLTLKLEYTKPGEKKPLNRFTVDLLVKKDEG